MTATADYSDGKVPKNETAFPLQCHGQPLKHERGFSAVHSDIGDASIIINIIYSQGLKWKK